MKPYIKYIYFAIRIAIALIFIVSGSLKLYNPYTFTLVLMKFISVYDVSALLSVLIPIIEVLLGILLLVGLFTRLAAIHLNALLVIFFYIIAYILAHKFMLNCGCFGSWSNKPVSVNNLIFQSILFVLNFTIIFDRYKFLSLDNIIKKN